MTEHPVTTWRERALKAEENLAGVKSQALEWKRALDEVTSSDWHQRQHEIEVEIERLKKNQCPSLEEHDAYTHMHTRALRAEAEVERQQTTIRNQAESIRLLYVVFLAAREYLQKSQTIQRSPEYHRMYTLAEANGFPYKGPSWGEEEEILENAIKACRTDK